MKNNKNFFLINLDEIFASAKELNRQNIKDIPNTSGIYFLFNSSHADKLKYVGQTVNLYKRLSGHKRINRDKIKVAYLLIPAEHLNIAEYYFIERFKPSQSKRKPNIDILEVLKLYCKLNFHPILSYSVSLRPTAKNFLIGG